MNRKFSFLENYGEISEFFVSSYTMAEIFLRKLFEENLIDIYTYVSAMNMVKEEYAEMDKKKH